MGVKNFLAACWKFCRQSRDRAPPSHSDWPASSMAAASALSASSRRLETYLTSRFFGGVPSISVRICWAWAMKPNLAVGQRRFRYVYICYLRSSSVRKQFQLEKGTAMGARRSELDIDLEKLAEAVNLALRPEALSLSERMRQATGRLWEQLGLFCRSEEGGPESRQPSSGPIRSGVGAQSALAALVRRRNTQEAPETENSMLLGENATEKRTWLG